MNISHAQLIRNENTSQQMLDSTPPKQANDLAAAKTFEFSAPTSSTLIEENKASNNTSMLVQNLLQSLQSLLSQASTQPSIQSNESVDYSESLRGFESSNMTMRQSPNASLRVTQGDARVQDADSGHELENGGRTEVFTVQEGEAKRLNVRSFNDLTPFQQRATPADLRDFESFSALTDAEKDRLPFEVRDGERPLSPGEAVNGRPNLDPRVESFFGERISSSGRDDYQFTAQYNITRAKETTIFQMLNRDNTVSDTQRPVLFLEAYTYEDENGNNRVRITDGAAEPTTREELQNVIETARRRLDNTTVQSERTALRNTINEARDEIGRRSNPELGFSEFPVAYDGPTTFDLEVNTNGRRAGIRIKPANDENAATQSYSTTFDRDRSTDAVDRGQFSSVRYGAYHHDGEGADPIQSTARLRVTDANLSRNQPE